jgi:phage-related protein
MRQKDEAFLALLAGDELDLVSLVEIDRSTTPLRYALDTEPRVWNGRTFEATSGSFGEIQESAEREVPALQLVLQNRDGVLGPLVHPAAGGEDLRGRRVTIRQASRALLDGDTPDDLVIEWTLFIESTTWLGREAVSFDLGLFPVTDLEVPSRTMQGLRCRWIYRGSHCGSTSDLPTCEKTREACALRFPDEPLRFGAFPSSADSRALRLA